MNFKSDKELEDWIEIMQLQNTSGGETENEMFRLGIEYTIEELKHLGLLCNTTQDEQTKDKAQ